MIDASAYAATERRLARLLETERDVLLLQGEAVLALEAVARGLGGPGVRALNLVSGPYGIVFGDWLAAGGATVEQRTAQAGRALGPDAVRDALALGRFDLVSVVHAEAANGVVNPLREIAAVAHAAGAIVVVDAVASVGAEPLAIDDWDLDLVTIGPQKALAGPAGVCALVAGDRGWAAIERNPSAPRESILSLLDWKQRWIDAGRQQVPGYVYEHEMRALTAALDELSADPGLRQLVERHRLAGAATRAGARALGLEPWVAHDPEAASVATPLRPPGGVSPSDLVTAAGRCLDGERAGLVTAAPGPLAESAIRVNHTGAAAQPSSVLAALRALAGAIGELGLEADVDAALAAAEQVL